MGNSHAAHPGGVPNAAGVAATAAEPKSPTNEDVPMPMGEGEKSVLQAKLTNLAIQIGYAGMAVSILTVIILCIRFSIKTFMTEGHEWETKYINYYVKFVIIGKCTDW